MANGMCINGLIFVLYLPFIPLFAANKLLICTAFSFLFYDYSCINRA